jgi:Xaa-Pro dipeptidase
MERAGMDALVLLSAEGFAHATGAAAGVATMWRRAGAVAVLVPADPGVPEVAVVSDLFAAGFRRASHITDVRESPIWVEAGAIKGLAPEADAVAELAALWRAEGRGADFARPETFDASVTYRHLNEALAGMGLARGRIGVEFQALSVADFSAVGDGAFARRDR